MAERAELDAVARGGSQGRAAYADAQALLASQKKTAINTAIAEAAQRGAPAGMQSEISATVGAPYERQIGNLAQASASRTAELGQLSAGNAAYMGQVSAAGPAMRGALERRVAAKRGASGGGSLSDSELTTRLLGAARVEREQNQGKLAQLQTNGGGLHDLGKFGKQLNRGAKIVAAQKRLATPVEARARQLGIAAGVDPNLVHGKILDPEPPKAAGAPKDPLATAAKLSPAHAADLRKNSRYTRGRSMAEELIGTTKDGKAFSRKDFITELGRVSFLANKPTLRSLLIAEYAHQFPGS